ncbi:hypothetical protein [Marinobacter sp.]|uniref:hypothetical protein n=1 Tax=Marinobacter sp. TaxID=50741 RepID=UPI002B486043|nr:hypothetical protein [Marinobacter sp.]HKK55546.1 hypothetical protein [Marinobacter sp.]
MQRSEPALLLILMLVLAGCSESSSQGPRDFGPAGAALDQASLDWIADQVFRNECAGREACLVHWNEGEAFPSLGIGHFIWYPGKSDGPFVESFPAMIDYLSDQGAVLPEWLAGLHPFNAPWADRESFLTAADTGAVQELRHFLYTTRGLQAGFLVQRARAALGRVIAAAPEPDREALSRRLEALVSTPGGIYAVIDYVNFKGEGLAVTERYNGQGWGLLQVLQAMADGTGKPALVAFRESAAQVLARRADNADRPIEKERWLPGWLNRLDSYREPG